MLDENDKKAEFLKEQLQCLREKNHRWKEVTIRQAIMWQAKSPCGYEMLRRSGCLTLPSRMTLKRYIGYCTGAVVSSLMKQRLHTESTHLSEREKMGSLIVDEMSLKQALTYEKKGDKVHGLVEMGGLEKEVGIQNELATHLLAFVFVGLSTHYTLPVGYYFTQSVKGDHLHQLTLEVIKSIEEAGFQVVRLVADNHASNKKMFTMLGNGRMMPVVPHPMDMNRRLFLSFDHCHILKNLRNQMLSTKRVLFNNGHYYSPTYLRKLLDITEKQSSFKLVRNLTQKHVYPTNFEKLSVKRAVEVFSPQACIRKGVNPFSVSVTHSQILYCLPTIELMEMIFKWFTIHNIRNTTFHVVSRDQNRMPFSSPDDDRLIWLEQEFLPFFAAWKAAAPHKRAFISLETYEALQLTTMSTVQCTQFLIRSGFLYVLTAKFSSDPVEALFSTIRQLQGSNDQTDARAALSSLQKVLVMGMMHSSPSGSTEQTTSPLGSPSARQASCSTAVKQAGQPLEMHSLVNQNQGSSGECAASTSATITQTMRPHLEALQTCRELMEMNLLGEELDVAKLWHSLCLQLTGLPAGILPDKNVYWRCSLQDHLILFLFFSDSVHAIYENTLAALGLSPTVCHRTVLRLSLQRALSSGRLTGAMQQLMEPKSTQRRQVSLKGVSSSLVQFHDLPLGSFTVDAECQLSSPQRQIVRSLAVLGRLRILVDSFCRPETLRRGLLCEAFVGALQNEMAEYYRLLAQLDTELNCPDASTGALTLPRVVAWTNKCMVRYRFLGDLVHTCSVLRGGELASQLHSCLADGDLKSVFSHAGSSLREARRQVSYLPETSFAEVARQGAAPRRPPAPVWHTRSEPAVTPSAASAVAASAAPPSKKNPPTSGLGAAKALYLEARPSKQLQRSQERLSSASLEAMDTTPSVRAQQAPKDRRDSVDRSKKEKFRVTAPGKGP
ncbi:hypothetical protein HPB51_011960 [Rhipicephalus microplus]|uniref:Transposable element n=1 Tax=Rhipicephalus microplus TaxID=6941 RepID=A0A9J6F2V6_RHIMP|nr:hypothetical protein HPB51_011960 [Rhipicephalus microplus]